MPQADATIVSVAVPVPLRRTFDFKIEAHEGKSGVPGDTNLPAMGARVRVPFGTRQLIGVVTELKSHSDYPYDKLKSVIEVLDRETVFDSHMWVVLHWLSRYYLAPIGEVIEAALPVLLRRGNELAPAGKKTWRLTEYGRSAAIDELARAPLQLAIIKRFMGNTFLAPEDFKQDSAGWRQAVATLVAKGWLREQLSAPQMPDPQVVTKPAPVLNTEQLAAAEQLCGMIDRQQFACSLLHGVTGSGKTEVYLAVMQKAIAAGHQVLMLVPEIGLTPQLLKRIGDRLACPIAVMHSGLNETERHLAWWHARNGNAKVVVGTRSAVFTAFQTLGLIIIDEEHDGSFKQQDGVRYQARDVAIYRAKQCNIPIVLGSATPSLETYANARSGRYRNIRLDQRATDAALPGVNLLDLNRLPTVDGLSPALFEAVKKTLDKGQQVMLFLNRRGYAPVLYCADCGQTTRCHRCDSHLTLHRHANRMRCHHCGYEGAPEKNCQACRSANLVEVGEGTQRVEDALLRRFPDARILRIDRDSTQRKGELQDLLEQAHSGQADIVLGTQLISKGHDFPNLAMVGIINADQGLYSTDFRASESLFQQVLQVAGRAGRRDQTGEVFIQTHFPTHPFFSWIQQHDFDGFAEDLLAQRKMSRYPPFGHFVLLRAESTHQARALQFLRRARADMQPLPGVRIMDAIPAPMERRAGKYRAQLLLMAEQRSALNTTLRNWLAHLDDDPSARKIAQSVRWSIDVDPLDHY